MIKLTKDDFSCWGNRDKYDDELIIEHDPKIESKIIADQILQNQKLRELIEKFINSDLLNTKNWNDEIDMGLYIKQGLQKLLEGSKK